MDEKMRRAFLTRLEENENDILTRCAYADWLDEQGEYDEATRQRAWPAAKAWLVKFCQDNNPNPEDDDPFERAIPYQELLERAFEAVEKNDQEYPGFSCLNNETMCQALRDNSQKFWQNWSVVTGLPLPSNWVERTHFSCSC